MHDCSTWDEIYENEDNAAANGHNADEGLE